MSKFLPKLILLSSILLLPPAASSAFFIEGLGGLGTTYTHLSENSVATFETQFGAQNVLRSNTTKRVYKSTAAGFLGFGYSQIFSSWFSIAIEAAANFSPVKGNSVISASTEDVTDENYTATTTLRSNLKSNNPEFDIDIKPSIFISKHTSIYGVLGVGFNRLSLDCQDLYDYQNRAVGFTNTCLSG